MYDDYFVVIKIFDFDFHFESLAAVIPCMTFSSITASNDQNHLSQLTQYAP